MGATVVISRALGAFRRSETGEVIYLIFEQTYDKRTDPHFPSWECLAIGTYSEVLGRIFVSAACCEGGALQSRAGQLKPETYLKGWRACFTRPLQMENLEIEIAVGEHAGVASIPVSHRDRAFAALERIGRPDLAARLRSGPIKVWLHNDIDVIIALYGVQASLSISHIIRDLNGLSRGDETLAPTFTKRKIVTQSVTAFAVDSDSVVVSFGGEPLKSMGWRYQALGQYIQTVALQAELQSSGSAHQLIARFRDACLTASLLPNETTIDVTPDAARETYYADCAKRLAVKLDLAKCVTRVPPRYRTTIGAVRAQDCDYLLSTLESSQVAWSVPEKIARPTADVVGHQKSLF